MSRIAIFGIGIAFMVVGVSTLKADDKCDDGKFQLSAGASIVIPTGRNLNGRLGFGSVFATNMKLTDRQLFRGVLEYTHFSEMDFDLGTGDYWQKVSNLRLEADWVYSFISNRQGPYVLGGVGIVNNVWKSSRIDLNGNGTACRLSTERVRKGPDFSPVPGFIEFGGGVANPAPNRQTAQVSALKHVVPNGKIYSSGYNDFDTVLVVGCGYATKYFAIEHRRDFDNTGRLVSSTWEIGAR